MLDCTSYCTTITGACTAANLQYSDMATCVASCAHFPVGTLADMGGDTLGCRLYHANAAKTDPGTHCVHAGPGGGGVCGMPCMGFCDLVVAECRAVEHEYMLEPVRRPRADATIHSERAERR